MRQANDGPRLARAQRRVRGRGDAITGFAATTDLRVAPRLGDWRAPSPEIDRVRLTLFLTVAGKTIVNAPSATSLWRSTAEAAGHKSAGPMEYG